MIHQHRRRIPIGVGFPRSLSHTHQGRDLPPSLVLSPLINFGFAGGHPSDMRNHSGSSVDSTGGAGPDHVVGLYLPVKANVASDGTAQVNFVYELTQG